MSSEDELNSQSLLSLNEIHFRHSVSQLLKTNLNVIFFHFLVVNGDIGFAHVGNEKVGFNIVAVKWESVGKRVTTEDVTSAGGEGLESSELFRRTRWLVRVDDDIESVRSTVLGSLGKKKPPWESVFLSLL